MIEVLTSDADGILTDLSRHQDWMVENYYTRKGEPIPSKKNPKAYDISDIYEISKIRRHIIWLESYKYYCLFCEARKESFETLKYWQYKGKKVGIVTARAFATNLLLGPTARKWYEEWQEMYDFVPDEIIWCPEKNSGPAKAKACKDLKSELMIEDKIDNMKYILEVCDTIGLNTPYNQDYQPKNKTFELYMRDDWPQIKETVDYIERTPRRLK